MEEQMPEPVSQEPSTPERSAAQGSRFLTNVLWNWLGVAVSLFTGFVLSPVVVRRLGAERYGICALVFSLLDYFWFFDFGINTAIVNFAARFQASGRKDKINELLNTALAFFSVVSVALAGLSWLASAHVATLFPGVSPQWRWDHGGDRPVVVLRAGRLEPTPGFSRTAAVPRPGAMVHVQGDVLL
jgi:hypothetical protein